MEASAQIEWLVIVMGALALVFMVAAAVCLRGLLVAKHRLAYAEMELATTATLEEQLDVLRAKNERLEQENRTYLEEKSVAQTRMEDMQARMLELEQSRNEAQLAKKHSDEARAEMDKQVSLSEQKLAEMQTRMDDWEKHKEEQLKNTKASVMEVGSQLSSKLLEDHKREQEETQKAQEKRVKEATKQLHEQFETLTKSVATIQSQSQDNSKQMEVVMRALTNPSGAGMMAEVGLENSLKNLGFEPGRDFMMQYHAKDEDGSHLRPDVVVFLPQDMVMVVDCKASQFITQLAQVEGTQDEEKVLKQLLASMQQHVDALARKQYSDAVAGMLKKQGRKMGLMFNVMYLPSDAALEKIRQADNGLMARCEKANLIMAGPASLAGLFSVARQQVSAARRDENQQEIIHQLREVMGAMVTALGHVDGVGRNIQQSAKKFSDFAKSMNRFVLPKLRSVQSLGVEPSKNKELPQSIGYYDVIDHADIVQAEAQEVVSPKEKRALPQREEEMA